MINFNWNERIDRPSATTREDCFELQRQGFHMAICPGCAMWEKQQASIKELEETIREEVK